MENEIITEEHVHKKGRHRKKLLYNTIMQQMEFYFSDSNLAKDKFLLPLIQNNPDVDISIFLNFNKIRKLTTNIDDVVKAIKNSQLLELSEDSTKVKRKTPFNVTKDVDNCTLYVERIKVDATHEWLSSIFSEFGTVTYVSIPKYKHNKVNKGFAFIEFEKEQEATEALNYFESIGCKMSTLMPPENLCSVITYESNNADEIAGTDNENNGESSNENTQKKRKHSTEESDDNKKKIKTDDMANVIDNNHEALKNGDFDEKKRKKQRKVKKKMFKELGLQVLSKLEWKKIRNRYLENQKVKMKQLKQFLNRKRFSNYTDVRQNIADNQIKNTEDTNKNADEEEKMQSMTYIPGVIVKIQLSEPFPDAKKVKEELKSYSTDIQYVDVSAAGGSKAYLRFSDSDNAKLFCNSDYEGRCVILEGKEEEEYWIKINNDRSLKLKKKQKHMRGREKLLKKAEKELGKHIKFDDGD